MKNKKIGSYDLIIVGAGPAGLTAGIYASRLGINNVVIGEEVGGQINRAYKIGNFPSESEISGLELAQKMAKAAKNNGVDVKIGKVKKIKKEKDFFSVWGVGEKIKAKSIILATGTERKKLDLPREKEITGRGIHYCFICDGAFYQDKIVAVVGGGNSALTGALYLAEIAKKVFLICIEKNKNELLGETIWIEKVINHPKIEIFWGTKITGLLGDNFLEGVEISAYGGSPEALREGGENLKNKRAIKLDGIFIEIGGLPNLPQMDFSSEKLDLTKEGLVKIKEDGSTNIKGFFAAGELTNGSNKMKQVVTAMSEGAIAAKSVFLYLKSV